MRSRPSHDDRVAEVTRRRLAALTAELGRGEPGPDAREADPSAPADPSDPSAPAAPSGSPAVAGPGRHARRPVRPPGRLAGWLGDHTPAAFQGRAHLGSAQVGLVFLVVAVGLLVAAFWLVRSAGGAGDVVAPRTVEPWVSDAASEAPTGASPSASTLPPADTGTPSGEVAGAGGDQIVVDVGGKVRRPGIAVLPVGARVVDAVRSAGGVRKGVRLTSVNMARLLTDGEQVLIGIQPVAGSAAGAAPTTPVPGAPTSALVNLNTADQAALETLPGVGPVTAAAILQWRTEHGGFTSVDELLEVSGIGEVTLAEIAPHVTL